MNQFGFDSHEYQNRTLYIIIGVVAGIIGAFLMLLAIKFTGLGVAMVNPPAQPETPPMALSTVEPMSLNSSERSTIDAVNRVSPSVVMITTNTMVEDYNYFAGSESKNIQGQGSGVVFRRDGYILTNNHVVNGLPGMAEKILVVLSTGKTYPAKIVGTDPQTDLAVLKIDHDNLPVPTWGDSAQIQAGQFAMAIGNPLAENLNNTVTVGVISAKGRNLQINPNLQMRNMIQTDASINPGNSGGPLLDSSGNVIGITSAIAAHSQGIGFAIPSNTVRYVAEQLINKGHVSRPGLGIYYVHLLPENENLLESRLHRRLPVDCGLFIVRVLKGTPADLAGIKPGDIVTKINNQTIGSEDLLQKGNYQVGAKLKLEYYHDRDLKRVEMRVGEMK